MKNEYLNRTVTLDTKSLLRAVETVAREHAETKDDPLEGASLIVAGAAVGTVLALEVLGTNDESITIRGEDFAVKAYEALRKAFETYGCGSAASPEAHMAATDCLWETMTILTATEDKLFGSDHVEEHESVKEENNE